MGWADLTVAALHRGEKVSIRPSGNSMLPTLKSGVKVFLEPTIGTKLEVGDIVLVKVRGNVYLHFIQAFRGSGDTLQVQIGNAAGHSNGWASRAAVYGKAVRWENP
jgi:hypothetical protein